MSRMTIGARRIVSSSTLDELQTTAFLNVDGTTAVVVMNATDKTEDFLLGLEGQAARTRIPAHAIMSLVVSGSAAAPVSGQSAALLPRGAA